ncbi:magnesium transporter NIPA2 [Phlebotomus argentipes]|uniref:magnesium transporter NIPA2 n=1 Tax=Phlebotomus argentipes TaxID=94469 RepID=UPI00289366A4|nr:magnesium transporter NIPA2 [Phlebotomus argentipes]
MSTSSPSSMSIQELAFQSEFYIGLGLAISSSVFIGSSFIIKKKALIRMTRVGAVRAGSGGFGYLKEWIWWAGLICMGVGEAANFAAYAFAPASLVTPLGALSVIVAAVMSSKFLNEKLNLLGKLGCFLCIIGSVIIVIHSPKEVEVEDLDILLDKLQDTSFLIYVLVIISVSLMIAVYFGPRFGHSNVIFYVLLCSSIGSLTVMSCKALGLCIRDVITGRSQDFSTAMPYILIITTVIFIGIQMNYLNRALDIFNTSIVTPVYYVIFTTLVIVASAILFKEWRHMSASDVIGDLCGFFVVIVAIVLLNAFKDMDVALSDVRGITRPKRQLLEQGNQMDEILIGQQKHTYGTNELERRI